MPKIPIILFSLIFNGLCNFLSCQDFRPQFIIEILGGATTTNFSKAPNSLANHKQLRLGKTFPFSAERIIKGKYGIGLQVMSVGTDFSNVNFATDTKARLTSIPNSGNITTTEVFKLAQSYFLVTGSYLLQKGRWNYQFKLGAGICVTGYNNRSYGFVEDSIQAILGFGTEGDVYRYVLYCKSAFNLNPQLCLRYSFRDAKKVNLAFFAGISYNIQRSRFEYIQQKWHYNGMQNQNFTNQTLLIWRQYAHQLSLRVGISVILNKKVN